jgi:hypothetical protein
VARRIIAYRVSNRCKGMLLRCKQGYKTLELRDRITPRELGSKNVLKICIESRYHWSAKDTLQCHPYYIGRS